MNRGTLEGKWKELKGKVKEQIGKIAGDRQLQQDGEAERVRGRIQNAVADKDVKHRPTGHLFVMGLILAGSVGAAPATNSAAEPDNSGVNRRDRSVVEKTAGDQGGSATDIELTRQIRKGLMKNENLSTYAQNVKIITKNSLVTLRGPVRNESEKRIVEDIAVHHAGREAVMSEIEIAK